MRLWRITAHEIDAALSLILREYLNGVLLLLLLASKTRFTPPFTCCAAHVRLFSGCYSYLSFVTLHRLILLHFYSFVLHFSVRDAYRTHPISKGYCNDCYR